MVVGFTGFMSDLVMTAMGMAVSVDMRPAITVIVAMKVNPLSIHADQHMQTEEEQHGTNAEFECCRPFISQDKAEHDD